MTVTTWRLYTRTPAEPSLTPHCLFFHQHPPSFTFVTSIHTSHFLITDHHASLKTHTLLRSLLRAQLGSACSTLVGHCQPGDVRRSLALYLYRLTSPYFFRLSTFEKEYHTALLKVLGPKRAGSDSMAVFKALLRSSNSKDRVLAVNAQLENPDLFSITT